MSDHDTVAFLDHNGARWVGFERIYYGALRTKVPLQCCVFAMSRRSPLESKTSIPAASLYVAFLGVLLAGAGSFVYAAFQPLQLPNPGLAAYHPPSAVEVLPLSRGYSTPPPAAATLSEAPSLGTADAAIGAKTARAEGASAEIGRAETRASDATRKTARARSHARDTDDSNSASSQWGGQWANNWSRPWPTRPSAQSYAHWPAREAHGRDPRSQTWLQNRPRSQTMTFAQYGFQRPW
jgi:hypothetical protein